MADQNLRASAGSRRSVNGILLLDKAVGESSNAALQQVKRLFNARKAGHTGNLDVLASGLLPICFGEATKICQFLLDADKSYLAEVTFGARTSTGDSEGEIISRGPTRHLSPELLASAMGQFVGQISQVPPMYSALKKAGQPLYRLARRGIELERAPRQVRISTFQLLDLIDDKAQVRVRCSKGTYIRVLAEDLGQRLGTEAFLSALRREEVGTFQLTKAQTFANLAAMAAREPESIDQLLVPLDCALTHLPRFDCDIGQTRRLADGQKLACEKPFCRGRVRLYGHSGQIIGIGEYGADGSIAPIRMFRSHPTESNE